MSLSPVKRIDELVQSYVSDWYLGDLLGEPKHRFDSKYSDLDKFAKKLFGQFDFLVDINQWIRTQTGIIPDGFWNTLEEILPASVQSLGGVSIENHMLFRNKTPKNLEDSSTNYSSYPTVVVYDFENINLSDSLVADSLITKPSINLLDYSDMNIANVVTPLSGKLYDFDLDYSLTTQLKDHLSGNIDITSESGLMLSMSIPKQELKDTITLTETSDGGIDINYSLLQNLSSEIKIPSEDNISLFRCK